MHDAHENEEEKAHRQVRDHILSIQINAMSWKDAAEAVFERGGDLSFGGAVEALDAYDPDRMPALKEASGTDQPLVPGGYRLVVLRRSYLNSRGNVYDSDLMPVSFSEPETFFDRPDLRGMDPTLSGYIEGFREAEKREQRLEQSWAVPPAAASKPRL